MNPPALNGWGYSYTVVRPETHFVRWKPQPLFSTSLYLLNMKYIINERQYKLLTEEQEVLYIPSLNVFGDWETLQQFLERRGNPLFSLGGDLDLSGTHIKSLGSLTSVGGDFYLEGCKNLTSLGNLTSVGGYLDLEGTNIESLGNLTSVGGSLSLENTPISEKYSEEEIRQMVDVRRKIFL